jgi:hypothetical protein
LQLVDPRHRAGDSEDSAVPCGAYPMLDGMPNKEVIASCVIEPVIFLVQCSRGRARTILPSPNRLPLPPARACRASQPRVGHRRRYYTCRWPKLVSPSPSPESVSTHSLELVTLLSPAGFVSSPELALTCSTTPR